MFASILWGTHIGVAQEPAQEPLPAETPTSVVIGAPDAPIPVEMATLTPDLRPPTDTPAPYVAPTEDPFAAANATAYAAANPGAVATPASVVTPDPNPIVIEVLPTPVEVTVEASSSGELPTSIPALPTFTPVPLPQAQSDTERVISIGETLTTLAAQSGFTVSDLATLNALTNPNLLLAGQKLKLPAPMSSNIRLHRVAAGETLMALAAQYDVSPTLLRQANQLVCSTCLVVGQLLRVPVTEGPSQSGSVDNSSEPITNLPAPFESISLNPFVPRQGDTLIIRVKTEVPLESIAGTLMDHPLNFFEQAPNTYIGLMGVYALLEPSIYPITIRAIAKTGEASLVQGRIQVGQGNFPYETLSLSGDLMPLLDPQLNEAETEEFAKIFSVFTPKQWWHGPMQQPIDTRFASYFGARRSFNNHTLDTYHSGVDMIARVGTPVMAAAPGRVAAAEPFNIRGNVIVIDHGRGVFTVYCHLSRFVAKVGDMVDTGEIIGYSGNTGRVLGPHVHWELAVGGVLVNPLDWMNEEIP